MSDAAMEAVGGMSRPLAEILTEVAEGRPELVYMGGAAGMAMRS